MCVCVCTVFVFLNSESVLHFLFLCTGHKECLLEAQKVRDWMQKVSKTDQKARLPREWLGKEESPGIRRLVSVSNIIREKGKLTRKEHVAFVFV